MKKLIPGKVCSKCEGAGEMKEAGIVIRHKQYAQRIWHRVVRRPRMMLELEKWESFSKGS